MLNTKFYGLWLQFDVIWNAPAFDFQCHFNGIQLGMTTTIIPIVLRNLQEWPWWPQFAQHFRIAPQSICHPIEPNANCLWPTDKQFQQNDTPKIRNNWSNLKVLFSVRYENFGKVIQMVKSTDELNAIHHERKLSPAIIYRFEYFLRFSWNSLIQL